VGLVAGVDGATRQNSRVVIFAGPTTAIFAVGAAIGRLSEDNPLRAAAEFSVIALGAGGIGYAAGLVISAIAGQRVSGGS
jgi:VIT1/CCC1 family predicted Fe2+/Mn2+ transporter